MANQSLHPHGRQYQDNTQRRRRDFCECLGIAGHRVVGADLQLSAFAISAQSINPGIIMTEEGFGQAYRKGFTGTVRLLRSRGASIDRAEDVAQTAWLQGWQKLGQLRNEAMIGGWINAIAINYHYRRSRQESRFQPLTELEGDVGVDPAPLDIARMDAAKILKLCRPGDRILFQHQLSGLNTKEIARKQRVSTTAIRIRLLRARRAVRVNMEDHAGKLRLSVQDQERCAAAG
jgi:RNA polymerase sigma-70 factor (ECF subfamily)